MGSGEAVGALEERLMRGCETWIFPKHDWSKWEEYLVSLTTYEGQHIRHVLRQKRVCQSCGFIQVRRMD